MTDEAEDLLLAPESQALDKYIYYTEMKIPF